jgi:hypothetical protein
VVVAAGCGTAAIKTTTGAPLSTAESAGDIGLTLDLTGSHGHIKMNVTVLAYLDHVTGGAPESGHKLVGVKIQLTNTGNTPYSGFPVKEGTLETRTPHEIEAAHTALTVDGNCPSPPHQNIAPGDTRVVCLPFELKKAQRGVAAFNYYLRQSNNYGEWILP